MGQCCGKQGMTTLGGTNSREYASDQVGSPDAASSSSSPTTTTTATIDSSSSSSTAGQSSPGSANNQQQDDTKNSTTLATSSTTPPHNNAATNTSSSSTNNNKLTRKGDRLLASYYGGEDDAEIRYLRRGIVKFNTNAKNGIEYLTVKHPLIDADPQSIANFLRNPMTRDGRRVWEPLSRQRIGEYVGTLGKDEETRRFQRALLDSFVSGFDFKGLGGLVPSLRSFLATFRLPGEAQVIDRIVSKFSDAFVRDNPGVFANADTAYVLAFAAIMLNTDLHSVKVKRKMTYAQFESNMSGIDGGKNVNPTVLRNVYEDIAKHALASELECDVVTFFSPARQGWMAKKCSGGILRWKKRYFLLADGVLYYFLSPNDVASAKPRCVLPLEAAAVEGIGTVGIRIYPAESSLMPGVAEEEEEEDDDEEEKDGKKQGKKNRQQANVDVSAKVNKLATPQQEQQQLASKSRLALLSPTGSVRQKKDLSSTSTTMILKSAKRTDDGVLKRGAHKEFVLRAQSSAERQAWLTALAGHASGGRMERIRRMSTIKTATIAMAATAAANAALQSPAPVNNTSSGANTQGITLQSRSSNSSLHQHNNSNNSNGNMNVSLTEADSTISNNNVMIMESGSSSNHHQQNAISSSPLNVHNANKEETCLHQQHLLSSTLTLKNDEGHLQNPHELRAEKENIHPDMISFSSSAVLPNNSSNITATHTTISTAVGRSRTPLVSGVAGSAPATVGLHLPAPLPISPLRLFPQAEVVAEGANGELLLLSAQQQQQLQNISISSSTSSTNRRNKSIASSVGSIADGGQLQLSTSAPTTPGGVVTVPSSLSVTHKRSISGGTGNLALILPPVVMRSGNGNDGSASTSTINVAAAAPRTPLLHPPPPSAPPAGLRDISSISASITGADTGEINNQGRSNNSSCVSSSNTPATGLQSRGSAPASPTPSGLINAITGNITTSNASYSSSTSVNNSSYPNPFDSNAQLPLFATGDDTHMKLLRLAASTLALTAGTTQQLQQLPQQQQQPAFREESEDANSNHRDDIIVDDSDTNSAFLETASELSSVDGDDEIIEGEESGSRKTWYDGDFDETPIVNKDEIDEIKNDAHDDSDSDIEWLAKGGQLSATGNQLPSSPSSSWQQHVATSTTTQQQQQQQERISSIKARTKLAGDASAFAFAHGRVRRAQQNRGLSLDGDGAAVPMNSSETSLNNRSSLSATMSGFSSSLARNIATTIPTNIGTSVFGLKAPMGRHVTPAASRRRVVTGGAGGIFSGVLGGSSGTGTGTGLGGIVQDEDDYDDTRSNTTRTTMSHDNNSSNNHGAESSATEEAHHSLGGLLTGNSNNTASHKNMNSSLNITTTTSGIGTHHQQQHHHHSLSGKGGISNTRQTTIDIHDHNDNDDDEDGDDSIPQKRSGFFRLLAGGGNHGNNNANVGITGSGGGGSGWNFERTKTVDEDINHHNLQSIRTPAIFASSSGINQSSSHTMTATTTTTDSPKTTIINSPSSPSSFVDAFSKRDVAIATTGSISPLGTATTTFLTSSFSPPRGAGDSSTGPLPTIASIADAALAKTTNNYNSSSRNNNHNNNTSMNIRSSDGTVALSSASLPPPLPPATKHTIQGVQDAVIGPSSRPRNQARTRATATGNAGVGVAPPTLPPTAGGVGRPRENSAIHLLGEKGM